MWHTAVLRPALGFIYLQLENVRLENSRVGADVKFVNLQAALMWNHHQNIRSLFACKSMEQSILLENTCLIFSLGCVSRKSVPRAVFYDTFPGVLIGHDIHIFEWEFFSVQETCLVFFSLSQISFLAEQHQDETGGRIDQYWTGRGVDRNFGLHLELMMHLHFSTSLPHTPGLVFSLPFGKISHFYLTFFPGTLPLHFSSSTSTCSWVKSLCFRDLDSQALWPLADAPICTIKSHPTIPYSCLQKFGIYQFSFVVSIYTSAFTGKINITLRLWHIWSFCISLCLCWSKDI